MKSFIAGCTMLVAFQIVSAKAQTTDCPDPWANLPGTYKCEGSCNYTASVCSQPDYTVGVRRWQFKKDRSVSATGIQVVSGSKSIAFATKSGWEIRAASTQDCAATISFEGLPNGEKVVWKRIDSNPQNCGARVRRR